MSKYLDIGAFRLFSRTFVIYDTDELPRFMNHARYDGIRRKSGGKQYAKGFSRSVITRYVMKHNYLERHFCIETRWPF